MATLPSLELKEFFTPGKTMDKAHVIIHIAEPNAPHELERGYLCVLMELTQGSASLIETCQSMIAYLEERYYDRQDNADYLLERILQAVNREFSETLSTNADTINCLVATIRGGEITVSYHGNPTAAVFFKQGEHLGIYHIVTPEASTGEAFFSELISGNITPNDFAYFATPHVADYFPADRVLKLLSDRPLKEVAVHMQRVLAEIGSDYSFGGLIAKPGIKPAAAEHKNPHAGSATSLNHLVTSAERTAETLSPPFLKDVKETFSKLKEGSGRLPKQIGKLSNRLASAPISSLRPNGPVRNYQSSDSTLIAIGRGISTALRGLLSIIIGTGATIGGFFVSIFHLFQGPRARLDELTKIRTSWSQTKHRLTGLPIMSKIIGSGLIITLVLFSGSLVYLKIHDSRAERAENRKNILTAISDKKEAAEASLNFEDKPKAQLLLTEAFALLEELKKDDPENSQTLAAAGALQEVQDRLRNERRVSPKVLADLGPVNSNAGAEKLAWLGTKLIAYGPNDLDWYLVDSGSGSIQAGRHDAMNNLMSASSDQETGVAVFLSTKNEVAIIDSATQTLVKKEISFPSSDNTISAIAYYNGSVYTVDTTNKKIYKHGTTQSGYSQGSIWNKSGDARLTSAVTIAIDGDLYILKDNGEVRKWYRGEEQGWSLAPVEPALTSATQMVVPAKGDELFILDTAGKRVLIFDKTGAFKEQLVANVWQKPSSIATSLDGRTVYVLDGKLVYEVVR